MLRRTVDLLKAAIDDSTPDDSSEATSPADVRGATISTHRTGVRAWYRFKIVSPDGCLQHVSIDAFDARDQMIYGFGAVAAGQRFTGYVFIGARVASIRLRLNFRTSPRLDTIATLRPISLIEYIWHSLRRGSLWHPLNFLHYFIRPPDPFILSFEFPRPPKFANPDAIYDWWIAEREGPAYVHQSSALWVPAAKRPPISVLMTVCDPPSVYLRKAIESVLRQTTDNWELCIADDASSDPEIRRILSDAARSDDRIKVEFRKERGGISAASNTALGLATSPFMVCLDHDDTLAPLAIETMANMLGQQPGTELLYSDEDKIDQYDNRFSPYFKTDFSRELLYSSNYINHLTAYRTDMVRKIGGWRSQFDGAQDYDLNLRILEAVDDSQIAHVPMILYHWRAIPGSAAMHIGYKQHAIEAGRRALTEHLARRSVTAQVGIAANTMYRVRYALRDPQPKVSIIIPFRDRAALLRQCVSSIQAKTTYKSYEILLVDNGSNEPSTLDLLKSYQDDQRVRVLHQPGAFNYSALNNRAAEYSSADYLCLLNNDTMVITPDWLEDMVGYASQPGVGCVGAKLYYENGTIQHAGMVLGVCGVTGHVFLNRLRDDPGYFGRLQVASNYSVVTGACLVVRRSIYLEVGGLDEAQLPVTLNDVDFCLKVRLRGYRNVVTPFAELFHLESASRGKADTASVMREHQETTVMKERYGDLLDADPYYSPHLTRTKDDFSLRID